jgi:hypothetical protein
LPPRRRAKSKWGRAAVAGVGDPGWVGWWHHPRCGEINGMNFALVSTVNQKAFRLSTLAMTLTSSRIPCE